MCPQIWSNSIYIKNLYRIRHLLQTKEYAYLVIIYGCVVGNTRWTLASSAKVRINDCKIGRTGQQGKQPGKNYGQLLKQKS